MKLGRVPIAIWVFLLSAVYYGVLSAKEYTWVFVSGDSGDWLAASTWWMVPQPLGSPLYILLGHFLNLFPGDLVIKMTMGLSVLPSAITVALVYLIVYHLTHNRKVAAVSSLVLLGSAVFLTQSTILEEYAIATMFVAAAYYTHLKEKRYLTAILLGLGTAIHAVVVGVVLFWLLTEILANHATWKAIVRFATTYGAIVATFYSLIPLLMIMDTPRLLAGGLSIESIELYTMFITGQIVGQLSLFDTPMKLLSTSGILLMSFGLALVPVAYALRVPLPRFRLLLLGSLFFVLWYVFTNLDGNTWTFITFVSPAIAILAGIGLSRLGKNHLRAVTASALILVILNGVFLNASILTEKKPLAQDYYSALQGLPKDAIVVANAGSYSLGLFYAMSKDRNDLMPMIFPYIEVWQFSDYIGWLSREYGFDAEPKTTLDAIQWGLDGRRKVYYADYEVSTSLIREYLLLSGNAPIYEVEGIDYSLIQRSSNP